MGSCGCFDVDTVTKLDDKTGIFDTGRSIRLYTEEQPPYNFITSQGTVSGSSAEVVNEIAKRTGDRISVTLVTWDKGIQTVSEENGTALFSTVRTDEREPNYKWVGPISTVELAFYGRKGFSDNISTIEDLRDIGPIAVVRNDVREDVLSENNIENRIIFPDDYACIDALMKDTAVLWFGTSDILSQSAKTLAVNPESLKKVWVYMKADLYIAFNRETPDDLIIRWQTALDEMKDDGTFTMIQERYIPFVCSWVTCVP